MKKKLIFFFIIIAFFCFFTINVDAKGLFDGKIIQMLPVTANPCGSVINEATMDIIREIFFYVKVIVPILLILFISLDLGKAVMAGSAEDIKKAQKHAITRTAAAIGIFFLPDLIRLILSATGMYSSDPICDVENITLLF